MAALVQCEPPHARRAPVYFDRNGMAWYRRNTNRADQRMVPVADQDGADQQSITAIKALSATCLNWQGVRTGTNLQLADLTLP
jgi:hypothetical protein